MSVSGAQSKVKHGDMFRDADGYHRILLKTCDNIWGIVMINPEGKVSYLRNSLERDPYVPQESVLVMNVIDTITNNLKDEEPSN